jgi:hypothetical protein
LDVSITAFNFKSPAWRGSMNDHGFLLIKGLARILVLVSMASSAPCPQP